MRLKEPWYVESILKTLRLLTAIQIAAFNPSVFGETLDEIMKMQASTHPTKKIPPILEFLSEAVVQLNGLQSEGLFRVPGDSDAVLDLKCRIEKNQYTLGDIQGV